MTRRIFDAHLHIIDPAFPLVANQGYVPPAFTVEDYRARAAPLGVVGGAVVSGSFQGFDQGYLVAALQRLGPSFVGVTQVPPGIADDEVLRLADAGVRAVRFNLHRGGSAGLDALESLALRVWELARWHVELYIDAQALAPLRDRVLRLPSVVVDHLGLSQAGLPVLLELVESGVRVKATGFARGDLDVPRALRAIAAANPKALLFGTDLPSTRAPRPFAASDIDLLADALGGENARRALLDNALELYRPAGVPSYG